MNDYTQAPATKMLATQCVCCGRPLVDARSVELGIGPECRKGFKGYIPDDVREQANQCVFQAALAAEGGHVVRVMGYADKIEAMGLPKLANKVRKRFQRVYEQPERADIRIEEAGRMLRVVTPFRRGDKKAFIAAWRAIPGRRYRDDANYVPMSRKNDVWQLLIRFFPGKTGTGPKGVFRVPKPEPVPEQAELGLGVGG